MDQFSGGEKRRLCIARAILLDSEVTVIDEPESGLDEDAKQVLMRTLATEFSGKSRSLVLITHDIRFSQLTNQIIEMGGACAVKAG
jgi:ABC-type transport system involved in cytochrome bd biosynthesis fused ATPase/permease subunit